MMAVCECKKILGDKCVLQVGDKIQQAAIQT